MAALPLFPTGNPQLTLWQTQWKSQLDPVLANALVNGISLGTIALVTGNNVIPHKLGRMMQGWILTDQDAGVTIYRSNPLNTSTLVLNASAPVNISLWVY